MGAQGSKGSMASMAAFAPEEQQKIEALFRGLVLNEGDKFSEKKLQGHLRHYFNPEFIVKLYTEMANFDSEGGGARGNYVTRDLFYQSLASMLKGSLEQRARLIRSLAGAPYEKTVTAKNLVNFVETVVRAYFIAIEDLPEVKSWSLASITEAEILSLSHYIVSDLVDEGDTQALGKDQRRIEELALTEWLSHNIFFQHMLEYVNQTCFNVLLTAENPTVPRCGTELVPEAGTLLDLPLLIVLNQALPQRHRTEWQLLFDSRIHGESSTNLMRLVKGQGPSVMIIQDDDGYIFGGFASASWQVAPGFRGTNECFLFSLRPTIGIYRSTGLNDNFMYMESGQETVPNGMGMGGQMRYFGLFLDVEYGRGHSKARPSCTTYDSPQLSKREEFTFTRMEVWAVGEDLRAPTVTVEDYGAADAHLELVRHRSVLDSDPGAKALLSLIGKATTSEGLRDRTSSNASGSGQRSRSSSNAGSTTDDAQPRSPSRSF